MIPDALHEILRVPQEQIIVGRIRAIDRICQPEILPDNDAVSVTGFEKLLVSCLADPVPDHREVHILMEAESDLIFARPVPQVCFRKAPVASAAYEAPPVDPYLQRA